MRKFGSYAALAIVLSLSACGDKKTADTMGAASNGKTAAAGSLILAAHQQDAFLPPDLADPRYADDGTLPMGPYQLPPTDFSKAGTETEPNNTDATATPMGPSFEMRGNISAGDYDHYVFETTGEPQLWAIEAVGKSVGKLMYYTAANDRAESQQVDSVTLVIPNLYLTAGKHSIEVQPKSSVSGPYTLRAVALGKPDLRMEREPNDVDGFAQALRAGISRVGFLLDRVDRDDYTFALSEASHVLLQVSSPPDITMMVNVYRTSGAPAHTFVATSKGQSVRMDLVLPPGEYIVVLRSNDKGSRSPYKVRLELQDPFASPVDREPNNDPSEAAPIPPDLMLSGSVGENGDTDWYRLPALTRETAMRFQVLGMSTGMNPRSMIHVINQTGGRTENLNWAITDSIWEMRLPPNAPLFVQLTGRGDYQLRLSFNPGIPPIVAVKAPLTVSLPPGPYLVEAFSTLAQTQSLPVKVGNQGTQRIQVVLEAATSSSTWIVTPARQMVTVDPGKEIQVSLQVGIAPDAAAAEAVQIAVRASSLGGSASATTKIYALCGATPVNPQTWSPLPAQMLGGLNLAAGSLGAHPVTADINNLGREKMLYDGMTPSDRAWTGDRTQAHALMLTVALAGDTAATLAGVTLVPAVGSPEQQVDEFDVLVSEDGQAYRQVLSGRLRTTPVEQAFPFAQTVRARFAQLRLRSNQSGIRDNRFTLGEWKVIAVPGDHPFSKPEFNVADPSLGGHVVWSQPLFSAPDAVITEGVHGALLRMDPTNPNEWVVGFRNDRAAQISRLEWVQPPAAAGSAKMLSTVEVSVSTESPVGPWTRVASWKIATTAGTTTPLNLPQPVWARFVRFSTTEPRKTTGYWRLAEPIRIYERGTDATYRSAIAEWGHYARSGIYERMVVPPAAKSVEEVTGNGKLGDAKKIEAGKAYSGRVSVEVDEDWYRIEIPRDHNVLSIALQGDPVLRAAASLQDEAGNAIAADIKPGQAGLIRVGANVEGGKSYFLKLVEPPRSIALVWDNSSSIRNFSGPLYRALSGFVETVQTRREFVNLMPFQLRPKFLLTNWSDQPYVLQGTVQNYNRMDASSDAESSLLAATQELKSRTGNKAILFITDANSDGYPKTSELWAELSRVSARVFTVELQLGNLVEKQQHLMQDWASAADGHYSTFRTSKDLDMAFDRTSCYLRRPPRYTLTAETRFEEPTGAIEKLLAKSGRVDVYGIYFDVGSATIKPESEPVLKEISDALAKYPMWKLRVDGHTDNVGAAGSNMVLSQGRAASVKQALITRYGIAGDRLVTAGFGASRPKDSNDTVKGRARNRRVELIRQ